MKLAGVIKQRGGEEWLSMPAGKEIILVAFSPQHVDRAAAEKWLQVCKETLRDIGESVQMVNQDTIRGKREGKQIYDSRLYTIKLVH